MKKLILLLAAATITSFTFAQKIEDKDVPAAVKTAFQKKYPNAKNAEWQKSGKHYKAMFENDNSQIAEILDGSGKMIKSNMKIKETDLPTKASQHISKQHPGEETKEMEKVIDGKGVVTYEVRMKEKNYYFDADGNFVKAKTKDEEKHME